MLKLSSSRGIRIDVPVLSVSWYFEDHSVIIQALRKGLIEHEASDTGGVPRWKSSCPDRLAEATGLAKMMNVIATVLGEQASQYPRKRLRPCYCDHRTKNPVPHRSSSRRQARDIDGQRRFCIWVVVSTYAPALCPRLNGGSDSHGHATVHSIVQYRGCPVHSEVAHTKGRGDGNLAVRVRSLDHRRGALH